MTAIRASWRGVKEVALIGGEFYLRDDWDQIAAEVTRCGMLCSVVTGARQLTPARVERARRAGIGKISISIDGLAQTHDELRGSTGSWRAAIDAARRVAASGIDLSVNSQINRLTMPELPAIADLLVDVGARSWMVILTAAMGRPLRLARQVQPTAEIAAQRQLPHRNAGRRMRARPPGGALSSCLKPGDKSIVDADQSASSRSSCAGVNRSGTS